MAALALSGAAAHDALLPRSPGGNGAGALLALAVHAALVVALTTAVDWRAETPVAVSAELWASVPQAAAPRPAEPPSPAPAPVPQPAPAPAPPPAAAAPPPAPDIALERDEKRKAEAAKQQAAAERQRAEDEKAREQAAKTQAAAVQARAEADRKAREQADRQALAQDQRLARQREENLKRMMSQAGRAEAGSGVAERAAGPSAAYTERLAALIRSNTVYTGNPPDNKAAIVEVRAAPGGAIIARRVVQSSGHPDWDDAVLRAIDRTATLPRDNDGRVPQTLIIDFKPRE